VYNSITHQTDITLHVVNM